MGGTRRTEQRGYLLAKRTLDVCVAGWVLAVTLPLMALVALAIRLSMGSPVLFRQERPGLHGELFTITKFRTMRNGTGSDEERLTRTGRLVRATSLDELPQLLNVLRGDMSLVGPRPLLPKYLPLYDATQARRHEVPPGITGLAQVSGRNALTWEERFALDVQYVEQRSLALDLRILWRTVFKAASAEGVTAVGQVTSPEFAPEQQRVRAERGAA